MVNEVTAPVRPSADLILESLPAGHRMVLHGSWEFVEVATTAAVQDTPDG
jgi:hypothetical protein